MDVKPKTMIVTGASKGIGAGVAKAFLDRGYNVVANSLTIGDSALPPAHNLALVVYAGRVTVVAAECR